MFQILLIIIYLSFISLGLPDSLLGAAWPSMYRGLSVPVSYAGIISMIIAMGTVVSSLQSDRLTRRFGTGKIMVFSVAMTAAALIGFSFSRSFAALCFFAVPYGLGAGSVDASLNNYVALHYESRHMSWLHCMWGVGAAAGPYVMGRVLTQGMGWGAGYRIIGILQIFLTAILASSLPLWKVPDDTGRAGLRTDAGNAGGKGGSRSAGEDTGSPSASRALSLREIIRIPGVKEVMVCFFCYCAVEQTTGLWAASYLNLFKGIPAETAAGYAGMFFVGITAGRAVSGFLTMKLNDLKMVRIGQLLTGLGILVLLMPSGGPAGRCAALAGFIIVGLGCAPVYPCIIHSTPAHFGADRSQAIIGVQMASAYVGTCLMPPLFGLIAGRLTVGLLPVYLLLLLGMMIVTHERLNRKTAKP